MHDPSMSKCYLCERYGYKSQVIFSTDGLRWNTPVPKEPETPDGRRGINSELGCRLPSLDHSQYSPYACNVAKDSCQHSTTSKRTYRFLKPLDFQDIQPSTSRSCSQSKWQSSNTIRRQIPAKLANENFKHRPIYIAPGGNNSPYNPRNINSVMQKLRQIRTVNGFVSGHRTQLPPLKHSSLTATRDLPTIEAVKLKQKIKQGQKRGIQRKPKNGKLDPIKSTPRHDDIMRTTNNELRINVRIPRCSSSLMSPVYPRLRK